MKRNVITLAAVLAIITGGFVVGQGEPKTGGAPANTNANTDPGPHAAGPMGGPMQGPARGEFMLNRMAERLNLTPEQKAKVQPILDSARPQFQQIREEAAQKMRSVMEGTMGQVRALLTPEQQAKFDQMKTAREGMHNAMQKMHEAEGE